MAAAGGGSKSNIGYNFLNICDTIMILVSVGRFQGSRNSHMVLVMTYVYYKYLKFNMAANNMTHLPIFDIVIHHGKIWFGFVHMNVDFLLKNVIYGNTQINLKKIKQNLINIKMLQKLQKCTLRHFGGQYWMSMTIIIISFNFVDQYIAYLNNVRKQFNNRKVSKI